MATKTPLQPANGTRSATDTVQLVQQVNPDGTTTAGEGTTAADPQFTTHSVTGIGDGRKVVAAAGTRETLAASTAAKYVVVTAETDNTGTVVVGGTTVVAALATRRGVPLDPGDTLTLEVDNLADVNLDVTVSGDGVTYTYLT